MIKNDEKEDVCLCEESYISLFYAKLRAGGDKIIYIYLQISYYIWICKRTYYYYFLYDDEYNLVLLTIITKWQYVGRANTFTDAPGGNKAGGA